MLTEEEDAMGKDRESLGAFNALDGAYMHLPATLRIPGRS
jgi:hypothetical protein